MSEIYQKAFGRQASLNTHRFERFFDRHAADTNAQPTLILLPLPQHVLH